MNKITLITASLVGMMTITQPALATECKLPKNCTYMDSEFFTGGGSNTYVMEVTCKMPNDQIVKYTSWEVSVGGLFGAGRLTMPRKIVFVPGNEDELECDY